MNEETWKNLCKDFVFTGVALREGKIACLLARADLTQKQVEKIEDYEIPTRVLTIYEEEGTVRLKCAGVDLNGFERPVLGASHKPVDQALIISNETNGPIFPIGGGKNWDMEYLKKGLNPLCNRIKCIDGYAWAVGSDRRIYKRVDINSWLTIDNGFKTNKGELFNVGFRDMDGFSDNDIYAAGGYGDIWHYNGKCWSQCEFPAKDSLDVICCAGDGYIYACSRDSIWRGKDNSAWERISDLKANEPLKGGVWFKGRLWLITDYNIFVWDGKTLEMGVTYQDKPLPLQGKIDANDDYLIVASLRTVWTFDGEDWHEIIPFYGKSKKKK